jgi:hypothetical protein
MRQAAAPIVCYSGKTERGAKSSLSLARARSVLPRKQGLISHSPIGTLI